MNIQANKLSAILPKTTSRKSIDSSMVKDKKCVLLTRNETIVDKEWIQSSGRNRRDIKMYEFNKINNLTAVRTLRGPGLGLTTIDHRIDHGDKAKSSILRASRHLGVNYTGDNNKLIRDYLMVRDADSLYFVGEFSKPSVSRNGVALGSERLQIKGNEAWIVEMFLDKLLSPIEPGKLYPTRFPIYMYALQMKTWCQLVYNEAKEYKWLAIKQCPRPEGPFIGVGGDSIDTNVKLELNFI